MYYLASKFKKLTVSESKKMASRREDDKDYLETDFLDSTIDEHQGCHDNTASPEAVDSNHLPYGFLNNEQPLAPKVFMGYSGGDGINRKDFNVVGFSLRSTEFAFLHQFLVRCGVKEPKCG